MATKLGLEPEFIAVRLAHAAPTPAAIEARLREDKGHAIKAVCVVHNETSTGATSRIDEVRRAIDAAGHPALLMVDTISSLASIDYRHDEWGVDVTVGGSQKGLMLPPGLGFNARQRQGARRGEDGEAAASRIWRWEEMLATNKTGFFPYTPATNLLYGLAEAIDMLHEEGLDNVFARHDRHAEATRRAVQAWGRTLCRGGAHPRSAPVAGRGSPDDVDAVGERLRRTIASTDLGRPAHRVDVTITAEPPDPRPAVTYHYTFRSARRWPRRGRALPEPAPDAGQAARPSSGWAGSPSPGWTRPRTCTCSTASPTTTRRTSGCSPSPRCATSRPSATRRDERSGSRCSNAS